MCKCVLCDVVLLLLADWLTTVILWVMSSSSRCWPASVHLSILIHWSRPDVQFCIWLYLVLKFSACYTTDTSDQMLCTSRAQNAVCDRRNVHKNDVVCCRICFWNNCFWVSESSIGHWSLFAVSSANAYWTEKWRAVDCDKLSSLVWLEVCDSLWS